MLSPLCYVRSVLFNRGTNRANACARAAVKALARVDDVFAVAFGNATNGALALTSTACDTVVGNLISHDNTSIMIYHQHFNTLSEKIKSFFRKMQGLCKNRLKISDLPAFCRPRGVDFAFFDGFDRCGGGGRHPFRSACHGGNGFSSSRDFPPKRTPFPCGAHRTARLLPWAL